MDSYNNLDNFSEKVPVVSVVQIIPDLHPASGGPSRTVVQLCDELAKLQGIQVTLLSQSRVGDPVVDSREQKVKRWIAKSSCSAAIKMGIPARSGLLEILSSQPVEVLHNNGIWTPLNHWASRAAFRKKIPLVIHPRGMLTPWALAYRGLKKRLALYLYQWHDLQSAALFIATAEQEADSIRRIGLRQPIAVIPNGVKLDIVQQNYLEQKMKGGCLDYNKDERSILFLSRIHPKKGLLNLLEAWAQISPKGWRLKIAGPDEGGHLQQVMTKARQLGIISSLDYLGEVNDELKSATYQGADLFVLPTYSENFGIVVTEALSHGLPVITTKGAPWADLETFGCGWWVDIGVEPLMIALREAMALTDEGRYAMGMRGYQYVRRYGWDEIAQQTRDVYRWLLAQGPRPSCVVAD